MQDHEKTKEQLIDELNEMRSRVAKSETYEAKLVSQISRTIGEDATIERHTEIDVDDVLKERLSNLDPVMELGATEGKNHGEFQKSLEALLHSAEEYFDLYNNAPNAFFSISTDGNIIRVNPRAGILLGIPHQDLIGKPIFDFYADTPAGKQKARTVFSRFKAGEDILDEELQMQRLGGNPVWISLTVNAVRDPSGQIIESRSMVLDITERKRSEEALRDSEERYKSLCDYMSNAVAVYRAEKDGEDFVFIDFNKAGEKIEQVHKSQIIGRSVLEVFPGVREFGLIEVFQRVLRTGKPEHHAIRKYKDERIEGWRDSFVYRLPSGELVAVYSDETDRKRAEKEKENLRAQLLQSQKMETMGTLAAGIAHDFNNMLAVILGYSSMLLADKNEGDPGYEGLQKILKTSQDAADLVQKIRIFGRKAEMILVPLDLNHQIDEVTKLLSSTLPKMIDIEIHLTKDPVIIKADSSQITQMVMNLAVNAGEAMPQGGRLSIQTENIVLDDDYCRLLMGAKPGPHVMLTVSDTGRGIDKGLMERIFDPFYSTKMRDYHKGTGLGLSVVQGIVQQHGGHITVESEVGKGTTFRMYFPALEVEIVPEYVEWKIPYPAGGNETILLVEDWEMVRELGVTILEKFGYTVLSACDGQEALDVYEKEQGNISLVILDIIMPRMDGKECLEQLLRINPAVKVIISSGVGYYDLINDIVKIGAKGAVNKPYGIRQLLGLVREVLDGD